MATKDADEPKMASMMRTAADKRGDAMAGPGIEATAPDYPYGLCIHMDKDELDKLGITDLPKIGTEMMMECKVKVTRISQSASEAADGSDVNVYRLADLRDVVAAALKEGLTIPVLDYAGDASPVGGLIVRKTNLDQEVPAPSRAGAPEDLRMHAYSVDCDWIEAWQP